MPHNSSLFYSKIRVEAPQQKVDLYDLSTFRGHSEARRVGLTAEIAKS